MSTCRHSSPSPKGPGSVAAPNLPAGFTDTFTSRIVEANGIRQHAVVGGDGPPLLLVHGWPESWYAWRLRDADAGAALHGRRRRPARHGADRQASDGYDSGTLAADLIALMDALGFDRFAVVGHDTGMVISYALAADNPDRVDRPGRSPRSREHPTADHSPPLFVPAPLNNKLWHIPFNRAGGEIAEQLIAGREDDLLRLRVRHPGRPPARGGHRLLRRPVSTPESLPGSLAFYRDWDATMAQNGDRAATPLTMPVLAIGGEESWGPASGAAWAGLARTCRASSSPAPSHWVAEEAPEEVLAALTAFLASSDAPVPSVTG